MHIIFCLRAREKVKIEKINGKTEVIPIGIQPIAEKNFVFEALVSLRVEEETHHAIPVKVPEPLVDLFPAESLVTEQMGARIREWNDGGAALGEHEQIAKRAKAAALDGMVAYKAFFKALTAPQKKHLLDSGAHEENKLDADQVDEAAAVQTEGEEL